MDIDFDEFANESDAMYTKEELEYIEKCRLEREEKEIYDQQIEEIETTKNAQLQNALNNEDVWKVSEP